MRGFLAASCLLVAALTPAQDISDRYAVLIDAEPSLAEFRGLPGSPLGSIADALRANGYVVDSLEKSARNDTLRRLYQVASEFEERDSVVVYLSGYVVRRPEAQGGTYWLQAGSGLETLEIDGVRIEEVAAAFRKIPSRRKVLLLDFVFLGDAAYAFDSDAKMQMQKQSRFYPRVSLQPGSLPLAEIAELTVSHLALVLSPDAASKLGARGLLGTLVRDAIAGKADGNADGVLRSTEMVQFIRSSIVEASLSHVDIQVATELPDDWVVTAAGSSVARARRERYLALLREWRDRNWISVMTELIARNVLDRWIESVEETTPLDPRIQEHWSQLQKHVEGSGNDIERARSLEAQASKWFLE